MAVSLKKPEKVSLEKKSNVPPTVREYTPEHLIDEAGTIQRPRQPPIQPQHSNELEQFLGDMKTKREDEIKAHYRSLFVRSVMALAAFCIMFLVIFLVAKSSPHVGTSVESASVESVPVESASSDNTSFSGNAFEGVGKMFSYTVNILLNNPFVILMFASTGLILVFKTVKRFINMR